MSAGAFHIRQAIDIAAAPERVWAAIVEQPSAWWGFPYLLLDGASTFELPLVAGGAVVERLGDATALWGHVSICEPGRAYGWTGQMGMGPAAWGEVRYTLEPAGEGTRVTVTHDSALLWTGAGTVSGADPAAGARGSYDYGWADLNARLRAFVETGVEHGTRGSNDEPAFKFRASA